MDEEGGGVEEEEEKEAHRGTENNRTAEELISTQGHNRLARPRRYTDP